jgi:hypothetical protein
MIRANYFDFTTHHHDQTNPRDVRILKVILSFFF